MRHTRTSVLALGVLGFLTTICGTPSSHSLASPTPEESLVRVTSNLPFSMRSIELTRIPARSVNVANFGAVGDGVALNTAAFAKAIESCANSGGGRVVVPQGIWLTGPIQLKSN